MFEGRLHTTVYTTKQTRDSSCAPSPEHVLHFLAVLHPWKFGVGENGDEPVSLAQVGTDPVQRAIAVEDEQRSWLEIHLVDQRVTRSFLHDGGQLAVHELVLFRLEWKERS